LHDAPPIVERFLAGNAREDCPLDIAARCAGFPVYAHAGDEAIIDGKDVHYHVWGNSRARYVLDQMADLFCKKAQFSSIHLAWPLVTF
jgi:hypothetical protein